MIKRTSIILAILCGLSCCDKKSDPAPALPIPDWSEATHGNSTSSNYSVVFPQASVNRIDITIEPADWQTMQTDLESKYGGIQPPSALSGIEPVFVPCTFRFNGLDWYKVGIRYKGNSSLKTAYKRGIKKLPLKFDFDEFEDTYPQILNQRFYGFKQLSFSNGFDDLSLIREKVTADIFRKAGVRAPQTSFYRVYLNHGEGSTYVGLYTAVEEVDDTMVSDQFALDKGNLYKQEGFSSSFALNSFNPSHFEKKNNFNTDWSDIIQLFSAIHSPIRTSDTTAWKQMLENSLDVHGFLRWLAINTTIQNWDTYGKMAHNYFLYADPGNGGRLTWIPWDNNEALSPGKQGGALSLSLTEVTSGWPLIRFTLDQPGYLKEYKANMDGFIHGVFYPSTIQAEYRRLHDLIAPYVIGAEGEIPGYTFLKVSTDFETAFQVLNDHASSRYTEAMAFLP